MVSYDCQYTFTNVPFQKCYKGWCLPPEKAAFVNQVVPYILGIDEIGEEGKSVNRCACVHFLQSAF